MRATTIHILGCLIAGALLAGCSGPATVTAPVDSGQVELARGEVLRVELGSYNASIGDSWHLVTAPDPAVLGDAGRDVHDDCPAEAVGCGGTLTWDFTTTGVGSTTIVFRYCYRSRLPLCDPGPGRGPAEPVSLEVTVR